MTQPFTYRVTHLPTGRWYYGVRYKNGCSIDDMWTTYFTSSKQIKKLILQDGKDSFKAEIRKIFDDAKKAIAWEARVLKRMLGSKNCINGSAFPATLPENRLKGHATKRKIGEDGKTGYQRAWEKWEAKKYQINPETGNTFEQDRKIKCALTRALPENQEKHNINRENSRKRLKENNPSQNPITRAKMTTALNKRVAEGTFPTTKGRKFPQISEKLKGKQFTLGLCWYNDGESNFRFKPEDARTTGLNKGQINLKNSSASKGYKYEIITCPHCQKSGGSLNMNRYHFNNCKFKP